MSGAGTPPLAPDNSLCVPDPATATNGVCGALIARDQARHLRHPSVSPDRRFVVAAAYAPPPGDSGPVFSPDGRFVAFERSGSIWRVPVTGGRATRIIRGARQPARGR